MRPRKPAQDPDGKAETPEKGGTTQGTGNNGGGDDLDSKHEDGLGKLLTKLASLDSKFDKKFDDLKKEVREGFQSTNFKVGEIEDKVKTVMAKCGKNAEKLKETADVTDGLRAKVGVQGIRLLEVERKIERLERDKRRNTIIVEGVPESEENPSPEIIEQLFGDLKVEFNTLVCDKIYRRGKNAPVTGEGRKPEVAAVAGHKVNKHRPIVVSFKELGHKIAVYKHVKNLQGLE